MMIFTHVLMGGLMGLGVALLYPGYLPVAVGAGLVGGAAPDLDMVFTHRRTLHFPVLSSVAVIPLGGALAARPTPVTVGAFCFTIAVALHSLTDVLGGGKEMRPWRESDDRAVFNHVTQAWIPPWRVFYDGSIADLCLSLVLALVLGVSLPPKYGVVVGAIVVCATVYTVLRRWITHRISEEYQTFSGYIQATLGRVFDRG